MSIKWLKSFCKALTARPATVDREFTEPLNNFTPRSLQVLALAQTQARHFGHEFVGTEHLLLGIISLGQGIAPAVLIKMGLELETVRLEVQRRIEIKPDQKLPERIPYTPRAKKVLSLAVEEARGLGHAYVGTEHILLGLLREEDGLAGRVLKELGVDHEVTRQHILKELSP